MQRFQVGDRVERLKGREGEPSGTVVRIVETDPQIVAICWDGDDPLKVSVMPSSTLVMGPS